MSVSNATTLDEKCVVKKTTGVTKTILIVEDDDSIGKFLVMALSLETPYIALHVTDGYQALSTISTIRPDLVITDYRLPRMDGLELYDLLEKKHFIEHTPVIVMSAYLPEQEIKKRKLIGMSKPFELDDLLSMVQQLLA